MNAPQTALLTVGVVVCALVVIAIVAYSISKNKPAKPSRRSSNSGFTSTGIFYDNSSGNTNAYGGWSSNGGDCGSGDSGGGGDCGGGGGD